MHNITNKHVEFDKAEVGVIVLCYKRWFTKHKNAAVTIAGWPNTTYFIEHIKDDEIKMLTECNSTTDLAFAIESLIANRKDKKHPVEWTQYAPK